MAGYSFFPPPIEVLGAQRLSASEIMAAEPVGHLGCEWQCSTPFGIRDHGGRCYLPCPSFLLRNVLNAFRHQRSWRNRQPSNQQRRPPCAQRLSASEIMAARVVDEAEGEGFVLNAFRHQRSWRRPILFYNIQDNLCSTPFGIRDHGGQKVAIVLGGERGAQRLSASEIMAVVENMVRRRIPMCSTPFGIRDHGGNQIPANAVRIVPGAQRLSASEIMADRAARGGGSKR